MKKTKTIFKTMLMVAVVFVMAQGCVPTGGPTINGTLQLDYPTEAYISPFNTQYVSFRCIQGSYNIMIYKKTITLL